MTDPRKRAADEPPECNELSDDEPADVEVFTGVRARSLRFATVPQTKVWFEGEPAQRSSSRVERENLPDEVEPGRTYPDIGARWTARARIVHPADAAGADQDRGDDDG
jgi:hypothetical protein